MLQIVASLLGVGSAMECNYTEWLLGYMTSLFHLCPVSFRFWQILGGWVMTLNST
jgi:hypothetical protein